MSRVSKEAIIRANNSTRNTQTIHFNPVTNQTLSVSVCHNGNMYSKRITLAEAKEAFAKAINSYGKDL